ncbi:hypothetical protein KRE40_13780 [Elizabethkingia meningoseptica]|uniref:Uncharacterized protein n=1 Tax=Elizabethkingia meningoseptica TaxID=238 RepID=A0A1V3TZQ0_ELIME|nr:MULTISPECIES: hypothetical protein [Elizabethkingia]AQX14101.1 hypothetical protein BBD35_17760 [Elizabethkingia meningoseptica]EJK5328027.1 hypothetical protein [Elizabethkingia meningoseptica]MBG0515927.1 hypothetical protein [Elizabethkingia meningoseptica]MDE5430216.1 hypothetical protein [Elizabethkingia meningoseptica]MDE5435887.1 hypothetical protein [Elizabethkingia meningoseptica]
MNETTQIDEKEKQIEKKIIKKQQYIPPSIDVSWVEMEQGIAANSGYLNTGITNTNPEIEDWGYEDTIEEDFEM